MPGYSFGYFALSRPVGFGDAKFSSAWKFCSFFPVARLFGPVGPEKRRSAAPARRPSLSEIFCSPFCLTAKWHHARKKFRFFFQVPPDRKDERAEKMSKISTLGKILRPRNPLAWVVQNTRNCSQAFQIVHYY